MLILDANFINLLLKVLFMVAFGIYVVFAIVITRQVSIMRKTLITSFSPLFTSIAYTHLIFAILVFIFFLLSL